MKNIKALIPLNIKYPDKNLSKFVQAFNKICPLDLVFLKKLKVSIPNPPNKNINSYKKDTEPINEIANSLNSQIVDDVGIPNTNSVKKILSCADKEDVDLIITAIKMKSDNLDISKTKEKLIYESKVPLIVLKNKIPSQIKHIVCPVKFSEGCKYRVINMMSMLNFHSICIHFIYVVEPKLNASSAQITEDLNYLNDTYSDLDWIISELKKFKTEQCPVVHKILEGNPKNEIAKYCNELEDSMVILPFANKKFLSMIFGNLIIDLIKELKQPVLLLNDELDMPNNKNLANKGIAKDEPEALYL